MRGRKSVLCKTVCMAGKATAQQLQTSILVAQQMLISDVINTPDWLARLQS